jgi:hypothetical protein
MMQTKKEVLTVKHEREGGEIERYKTHNVFHRQLRDRVVDLHDALREALGEGAEVAE